MLTYQTIAQRIKRHRVSNSSEFRAAIIGFRKIALANGDIEMAEKAREFIQ